MVINRVRIGHTLLADGYPMNDDVPDVAPIANFVTILFSLAYYGGICTVTGY